MMNILNGGKHADNQRGLPGVHDSGRGERRASPGAADGGGVLRRAEGRSSRRRTTALRSATEGGFAPLAQEQRRGPRRSSPSGVSAGGYNARHRTSSSPSTPATTEMYDEKSKSYSFFKSAPDKKVAGAEMNRRTWEALVRRNTPFAALRTAWPRTTGPTGPSSPRAAAAGAGFVGDDLFSTNTERLPGASARRGPTRSHQGEPDWHADRDPCRQ